MSKSDTPVPASASIHAIKFKFVPSQKIKDYIEKCGAIAGQIATFLKDNMESSNQDLKELIALCATADASFAASNLAPFFWRAHHKFNSFNDVPDKKTPVTKIQKRHALVLRQQGVLPLPYLTGLSNQVVTQLL